VACMNGDSVKGPRAWSEKFWDAPTQSDTWHAIVGCRQCVRCTDRIMWPAISSTNSCSWSCRAQVLELTMHLLWVSDKWPEPWMHCMAADQRLSHADYIGQLTCSEKASFKIGRFRTPNCYRM
jgi:hypothetical protein